MKTKQWKVVVDLELSYEELMEVSTLCSHCTKAKDTLVRAWGHKYHKLIQDAVVDVDAIPAHIRYPGQPVASD